MTQEDKELVLKDLCARLPYKPICQIKFTFNNETTNGEDVETIKDDELVSLDIPRKEGYFPYYGEDIEIENIKPYLRPMSSMTKEEDEEYRSLPNMWASTISDWFDRKMFDHRGLIPKGLALEAPEGMYNKK